jgi:hypothetical protein
VHVSCICTLGHWRENPLRQWARRSTAGAVTGYSCVAVQEGAGCVTRGFGMHGWVCPQRPVPVQSSGTRVAPEFWRAWIRVARIERSLRLPPEIRYRRNRVEELRIVSVAGHPGKAAE